MDNTQLAQMVTWLDEQHRRDRAELTKLQQRIDNQTNEAQDQARRIQQLEAQLVTANMKLGQLSQMEQALQNLRNEVALMIDAQKEENAKARREFERSRMTDREGYARELAEVRKQLGHLREIDEALTMRKAEEQRLGEITLGLRQEVTELSKSLEQRTRNLSYILEQRDYDNKRLAQVQQETIDLFKRVESIVSKMQVLEQKQQRIESALKVISTTVEDMERGQAQFIESLKLADADRQRQMKEWEATFTANQEAMQTQQQQLRDFALTFEKTRQALTALQQFREQIQSEQNQVAELQRLAEERQRKELKNFTAENEKRWKKQLLEWQFHWDQQDKVNSRIDSLLPRIEQEINALQELSNLLWQTMQAQTEAQLNAGQEWLQNLRDIAVRRDKINKIFTDKITPVS